MDTQTGDRSGDFSSEEPEFVESDPEELCYRLHAVNVLDRAWRAWRAVVAQGVHNELRLTQPIGLFGRFSCSVVWWWTQGCYLCLQVLLVERFGL